MKRSFKHLKMYFHLKKLHIFPSQMFPSIPIPTPFSPYAYTHCPTMQLYYAILIVFSIKTITYLFGDNAILLEIIQGVHPLVLVTIIFIVT